MLLNKDQSLVLLIDVQQKLIPFLAEKEHFLKQCQWMLKLAHKMAVPIVVSEQYPQGLGNTLEQFQPFYAVEDVISKRCFSCLGAPAYLERLQEYNQNQMVLIGIETHVCVLQTALDLIAKGYQVFVVVNAVASRELIDKKYALKRIQQAGGVLITTEMVLFEWLRTSADVQFKAISKEFLQQGR